MTVTLRIICKEFSIKRLNMFNNSVKNIIRLPSMVLQQALVIEATA